MKNKNNKKVYQTTLGINEHDNQKRRQAVYGKVMY